jgi:hypothetical protein
MTVKTMRNTGILDPMCSMCGQLIEWSTESNIHLHETYYLKLYFSKVFHRLAWGPILNMQDILAMTVDWYNTFYIGEDPRITTLSQIKKYQILYKENLDGR